ncbi:GAF domain-containing protein [uncultured Cellulomonas sp.]|uniref:GAF domain-containing protein n=1 Tax=uncultured Cellulomonas sp. TaxID=189682 RepID=UPI0026194D84|nr:GAF domain-containing protein [uncultured Cellulomonas sp.]
MTEAGDQQAVEARLLGAPTLRDYLDDFVLRAGNHLGEHVEVCISLRHSGADRLAATSSARAARCDEVEYRTGAGPCVTAMDTLRVVMVPDVAGDGRWPDWQRAAVDAGFRSAAGVPAHVSDGVDVALNLYSPDAGSLDRSVLLEADRYVQHAAVTVGLCLQVAQLTTAYADARRQVRELEAINRLVVEAVTGHEGAAAGMLDRIRRVVRTHGDGAAAEVRSIIGDVGGRPGWTTGGSPASS